MNTKAMMNWILYGNTKGNFSKVTKPVTHEFDDFIKNVYGKKCMCCNQVEKLEHCENTICHSCYVEQTVTDDER